MAYVVLPPVGRMLLDMEIIELPAVTRRIGELLSAEEYRRFQLDLIARPDIGPIKRESGGLRKVRWSAKGHGKSGGVRVIYYWDEPRSRIFLLFIYPKNEQEDLTPRQWAILRALIAKEVP
ncbi:type II toxin-antitoxin system RelE/ParE family toxin [soil metagenome]